MTWTRLALSGALFVAGCTTSAAATPAEQDKFCKTVGDIAYVVMQRRQNGDSISSVINVDIGHQEKEMIRPMIMRAFEKPIYKVAENQERAAREFRADSEYLCYQAFAGMK